MIVRCRSIFMWSSLPLATFLLLVACVGPAREPVGSFSSVGSGEAVLVGRVELVPALGKSEQRLKGLGAGRVENKLFLITDHRYRVLKEEPVVGDFDGRIEAVLGETFFVRTTAKPFYVLGGMLYLSLDGAGVEQAFFPGGLKVALTPEDKAVYIGTIQYHRNEFFEITKVAIVDDYGRSNAEFKRKFGGKHQLRKALLIRVRSSAQASFAHLE